MVRIFLYRKAIERCCIVITIEHEKFEIKIILALTWKNIVQIHDEIDTVDVQFFAILRIFPSENIFTH